MKKYLQDYDKQLERELERVKAMPNNDSKLLLKYHNSMISNEISVPRLLRATAILRMAREFIQKPFSEANRDDWENHFVNLKKQQKAETTIDTYKATVKVFTNG
jgi:hypothetical protein